MSEDKDKEKDKENQKQSDELSEQDLGPITGGSVTLDYGKIEWTYTTKK